ncbi:hypothetical protein IAI10_17490 [Clostridium sp. 19966]|uniref:hypothetical protein n=1 Tax=Clostridium sp. 19966 TaxID=2768166 RepID=UPI0028DD86E1|nr:hypothetical protein [Clostridium sp. 19966]MDT8718461.1 hypothetical protein [Clostridium sp. 19966]
MDAFSERLICNTKGSVIPEEYNYFGKLVGEWDIEYVDSFGTDRERHVKGEWIFSWILDGTAIQDIFICPSTAERLTNVQPDAEYGTTLRIYNPNSKAWDIFYGCTGSATRLEAKKEENKIVLTEITNKKMKWIFSDITENQFHWQNISTEDGDSWHVNSDIFATRR